MEEYSGEIDNPDTIEGADNNSNVVLGVQTFCVWDNSAGHLLNLVMENQEYLLSPIYSSWFFSKTKMKRHT